MIFTQNEWLHMFGALDSKVRFNILIHLVNEGAKTLQQISDELDIYPPVENERPTQVWIDCFINPLLMKNLIDYADRPDYTMFEATDKGKKVLEVLMKE